LSNLTSATKPKKTKRATSKKKTSRSKKSKTQVLSKVETLKAMQGSVGLNELIDVGPVKTKRSKSKFPDLVVSIVSNLMEERFSNSKKFKSNFIQI
jgi:hypothetical protein